MKNEINPGRVTHSIHIITTLGAITIDCERGSNRIGYHYKPINLVLWYRSVINRHDPRTIKNALKRSHIDQSPRNFILIQEAASTVLSLANQPPISNKETIPNTPISLPRYLLKRIFRNPLNTNDNQYFYYVDRTTWVDDPTKAKHFISKIEATGHKKLLPDDINPDTVEILETIITLTPNRCETCPEEDRENCRDHCPTPANTPPVSNKETTDPNCDQAWCPAEPCKNCPLITTTKKLIQATQELISTITGQ